MAKDPKISPEDSALFRESVGSVRPVKYDQVELKPDPPPTRRRQHNSDGEPQIVQDPISDDYQPIEDLQKYSEAGFVRLGIQQGVLRKLRRGQFETEAELDLHGLTVAKARAALLHFLHTCRDRGVRHVRIIHGQGNSSPEGRPVLKGKVHLWLQQLDEVLAFCPARPEHGGNGAVYVLIKRH